MEKSWNIGSAGSWAKVGLTPIPSGAWIKEQLGLDLSNHRSRAVSRELITNYDLILVMEKNQKEALQIEFPESSQKIFLLTELSKERIYDIPDPVADPEENFYDVAQEITHLINKGFREICRRAAAWKERQDDIEI